MNKKIIIANWKANPSSIKDAIGLAQKIERGVLKERGVEVVIAPPFPFLTAVGRVIKKSKLGAQDAFWSDGPFTGEVSWKQLKNLGVEYVIVGHSERKLHLGETDELINKKVRALLEQGMKTILCVGERQRNGEEIPEVVGEQLKKALQGVKRGVLKNLIVAYEPIWAISTMPGSRPDTPDSAFRALIYIRRILTRIYGSSAADKVRIIYGGSVRPDNISPFLREGKMEGALVGGASLIATEFIKILRAAGK